MTTDNSSNAESYDICLFEQQIKGQFLSLCKHKLSFDLFENFLWDFLLWEQIWIIEENKHLKY